MLSPSSFNNNNKQKYFSIEELADYLNFNM